MKTYKVLYQKNNEIKTLFLDEKELDNLPLNTIRIKKRFSFEVLNFKSKIKKSSLITLFHQLSIMLNANMLFLDAIDILYKSLQDEKLRYLILAMKKAVKNGEPIYKYLEEFRNEIDIEIILFFKLSHQKTPLKTTVNLIHSSLKNKYENKKLIVSKLRYPVIVLITLLVSLSMIFLVVVPKFEYIFVQYNMPLPLSTQILIYCKNFLINYSLFIFLFFILMSKVFKFYYKKRLDFSFKIDMFIFRLPILGKLLLTYEVYMFFVSLNSLLRAKYDFQESVNNAMVLLKNKYLLDRITKIDSLLRNGSDISSAFQSVDIFDDVALSLIHTGEQSSTLSITINEIVKIYKEKFDKSIKDFSSLIEPLFFIGIMLLILWVILSIFMPIWSMQEVINV